MRRALVIGIAVALAGCGGLKLAGPPRHPESGILMLGGSPSRNNNLNDVPPPPLSPEWDEDVTAGIGDGAPCLVDSILFIGNLRGELYALHAATGKRLGWVALGGAIQGTPVIAGSRAIVALAGGRESVVAYDLVEGRIRWRFSGGDVHGSPLLLGTSIYAANVYGVLTCLSLGTGEKMWSFALPSNTTLKGIRSSPAGQDSSIVFGADDGSLYCCNALTGTMRWRVTSGGPIQATPVIHDGTVYVGTLNGDLVAVDLRSGSLRWSGKPGSSIYGAAVADSAAVIVGTTGGHIVAMDPATGATRWNTDLRSPVDAGLLGAGDVIYAGTLKKELIALKRSTGEIIWRTTTDGRIKTTPIGGLGRVFIAQDTRIIRSFRGAR
ncbi:MAG: PQQ-binding-like beta-propeller repeat protein [Ignavibacteriae bacterium]|nr:PQQ-binding-like beta-propeller repeat protein [Ignavibacteriota bacterium]